MWYSTTGVWEVSVVPYHRIVGGTCGAVPQECGRYLWYCTTGVFGMGVVLAVNRQKVQGRNMCNDYALN